MKYYFSGLFLPILLYLLSPAFWLNQIVFDSYLDSYSFSPSGQSFVYLVRDLNRNIYWLHWQKVSESQDALKLRFDVKPIDLQWIDEETICYLKNAELYQYFLSKQKEISLPIKTTYYWLKNQKIYYRVSDNSKSLWVYELKTGKQSKIFEFEKSIVAFNLSPDSAKLAFIYYKDKPPANELKIFDLEKNRFLPLQLDESLENVKFSLPFWNNSELFAFAADDVKNYKQRLWFITNLTSGEIFRIYKTSEGLYQNPFGRWQNDKFYLLSSKDGWSHLYEISTSEKPKQLTNGPYEIKAFDFDGNDEIIFQANKDGLRYWDLFRFDLKTQKISKISFLNGTHADFTISADFLKMLFSFNGPTQSAALYLMDLRDNNLKLVFDSLPAIFDLTNVVFPRLITIPSSNGNLYGWLWLPKNFDENQKYPALLWLHGGPAGQIMFGWHNYLSYGNFYSFFQYLLNKNYVILGLDYHGSSGYGHNYISALFDQGGNGDVNDVLVAAKYLKSLKFIDSSRLALMGFSYGGYLVNKTLVEDKEGLFQKGISIAGPSDWSSMLSPLSHPIFYLVFGGWPEDNAARYKELAVIDKAENLKSPLLIIHGLFDSTVPVSQAKLWVAALEKFKKPVSTYYYSSGHVPSSKNIWVEIFKKIIDFLTQP